MNNQAVKNADELSAEEKRQLLAQLLQQRGPKAKFAPLSFGQERLWFLYQLDHENAAYNLRTAVNLHGHLNIPALRKSLEEIVARHESLRTTIVMENGRSQQKIHPQQTTPLPMVDLTGFTDEQVIERETSAEAQAPFDLINGPLFRAKLLKCQEDEHILLLTMHHIISDGWSIGILISEIAALYRANVAQIPALLPNLSIQYADFATWQREWLQGEMLEKQLGFWREQLRDTAVVDLPTDYPRPAIQTFVGTRQYFTIPPEIASQLRQLTQAENATLFMTLLAAFNLLLHKYSQQTDIAVGTPIAGRNRNQLDGLIGLFINTLVMRSQIDPQASFRNFLHQVRQTAFDAYDHQDIPFEKLVEELQPPRDPSRTPYFQHLFILQNAPMQNVELAGLTLSTLQPNKASSLFDITLVMWDRGEGLSGYLEYNTDLFAAETMTQFVTHFQQLLRQIGQYPDVPVAQLAMLTEAEQKQIIIDWNETERPYPQQTLTQLISQQAKLTPDALAVTAVDGQLTYAELDNQSSHLAAYLRQYDLQPDSLIGLALPRQTQMIVAILGILKAGAAYLPIDPAYPAQRIQYMLNHAQAPLLITTSSLVDSLPEHNAKVICIDSDWSKIAAVETSTQDDSHLENLAYVIYTSGSTGTPKGVQITQRNLVNFLSSMQDTPGISADDTLLAVTTLSFDIATLELYLPLISGARVLLASQEVALDAQQLMQWLDGESVTMMQATPATWQMLLSAGWQGTDGLKILSGGEALPAALAKHLLSRGTAVFNMYGPTETTVWSTCLQVTEAECQTDGVISIGTPIANTDVYILDDHLQPVPIGAIGNLYIGGEGVARGYLHQPDLTAERFPQHPFKPHQRIYFTGDVARYRRDGRIEFLGRSDHQVKVRGFRIELGEIENSLQQHPAIAQAVVHPHDDQLVAYLIIKGETEPDVAALRAHVQDTLPAYMVPHRFLFLDAYPLTPNGKVDRKALPAPASFGLYTDNYIAPRSPVEEALVTIWQDLLNVPRVGIEDDFFALGGHSLLATQLVSRVRQTLNVEIPLRTLFEAQTIAELAKIIANSQDLPSAPAIEALPHLEASPLSFAQQRLWVLDQLEPNLAAYNIPAIIRLTGKLDRETLQAAFNQLITRHYSLRTAFAQDSSGQPVQQVHDDVLLEIPATPIAEEDVPDVLQEIVQRPFSLTTPPLIRVELLQVANDDHLLVIVMHHIISDGWSMNILVRELAALYHAIHADYPDPLPKLAIQYPDFAAWQRNWLQGDVLEEQIAYWQQHLADAPATLNLPTDFPRPAIQSYRGAVYRHNLPTDLTQRVIQFSRQANATPFMTLMAAYQLLLARYSGQHDVVVGSPIANRNRSEIENLIGFFVNMLILRTQIGSEDNFNDVLAQVRQHALDSYTHQDVPFEKLVDRLNVERDLSYSPVFQVAFILQNTPQSEINLGDVKMSVVPAEGATAKYDLTLTVVERENSYRLLWEYCTDLFTEETIARMAHHFVHLLEGALIEPEQPVLELPLLSEAEQAEFITRLNETERPYPQQTLTQLFTQQAKKTPDATAVTAVDGQAVHGHLTYAQLDEQSNQLAAHLRQYDLPADSLIGLALPRQTQMLVAILGILKAGAAYLPIDPAYPAQRIQYMLNHAQTPLLITTRNLAANLPDHNAETLLIDEEGSQIAEAEPLTQDFSQLDNLAYVIYTSGSTGTPKGVQITQRNLVNFLSSMQDTPGISADDTLLAVTTLSFDIATLELYLPLISGARVLLASQEVALDAQQLTQWLAQEPVTMMQATPATWQMLLAAGWQGKEGLTILSGGEALPASLAQQLLSRGTAVFNMYGPTETTVWSTCLQVTEAECQTEGVISIGTPIANTNVYILDDHLQPVPIGAIANLYIGGDGVARGYLHQPELTAERFPPHPFKADQRIYFTGDVARYRRDGRIEFLGRSDHQVKVRGFRIELGEIENSLQQHPAIAQAVVHPHDDQLVAYLITTGEAAPDIAILRAYVQETLPAYMVPHRFLFLDTYPLTPNGKVDRKALPAPANFGMVADKYVAPRSPIEEALVTIWQDLLNVPRVGIEDDFFELGGHSLLATQLVSRVRQTLDVEIPLRTLFEAQTIAELAKIVANSQDLPDAPAIEALPHLDAKPLSFAQQRLWVLDQLEPNLSAYNIPTVIRLTGKLDQAILQEAFNQLLIRHHSLRTAFAQDSSGQPMQQVHDDVLLDIPVTPVTEDEVPDMVQEIVQRPFSLTTPPLIRITLLQVAADDHLLVIVMHHIISDGWSMNILVRELAALYHAIRADYPDPLPKLAIQYPDFAAWQRNWLQGEVLEEQIAYWQERLAAAPPTLNLPTDFPRPAIQSYRGAVYRHNLPTDLTQRVIQFSRQANATPFMTLMAAYQLLLARYSGQHDVVVGSPIANRNRSEIENLIGFFVNMLILRTQIGDDDNFNDVLAQVRQHALDSYTHQDVPFEKLVDRLNVERDLSYSPVFQVAFILQNTPRSEIDLGEVTMHVVPADGTSAKYDLTLTVLETKEGYRLLWEYCTDLFSEETIVRMANHFVHLLEGALIQPEEPVLILPLLSEKEQEELIIDWNDTKRPYPQQTLTQLFSQQAKLTPDATAVTAVDGQAVYGHLTYAQLDAQSNQLAAHLRQYGLPADSLIGLALPRQTQMLVAILGILKAGAAYLPIDPAYPAQRIQYMLNHAQAPLLITTSSIVDSLPEHEAEVICIDTDWEEITAVEPVTQDFSQLENLAYVIYTSGSTGTPKGVQITQRNLVNFLSSMQVTPGISADDTLLAVTTLSFDIATLELYLPLISGAQVLLASQEVAQDAHQLRQLLDSESVTMMQATPATWQMLLAAGWQGTNKLKILSGGEALPAALAEKLLSCGTAVFNMYGPTETTVWSTCLQVTEAECQTEGVISIGTPIANTDVYILDDHLQPVPIGAVGNLYIGGDGVARGYLHQPELTAERFPQHPFKANERIYFTGDVARYRRDGRIEFLGRSDHQVKVRGFRIELGEIENSLQQHPAIAQAVVHPHDDQLVAYLIAKSETEPDVDTLRAHVQETLPAYMVPHRFLFLEAYPLTPNGKVDRKALPAPEATAVNLAQYVPPSTPEEEILAEMCRSLLKLERVGIHDNFFNLGGHSLLATQMISNIRTHFEVDLPLRTFFEHPTIAGIAQVIAEQQQAQADALSFDDLLSEIEALSEDEVEEMQS